MYDFDHNDGTSNDHSYDPNDGHLHGFTPTGDHALDDLQHEVETFQHDVRDFTLPDDMVSGSVNGACEFFNMIEPSYIINDHATGVDTGDPFTHGDDVLHFARQQMIEMGIYGQDALDLVMTHEMGHRFLQEQSPHLDSWEEELACDYFAGFRAGLQNKDISHFQDALEHTEGSVTHPDGTLRAEFIEYGKQVAEQMQQDHITPTFENCIDAFNKHFREEGTSIAQQHETVIHNEPVAEHAHDGHMAFTGKYTDAEISKMRDDVSKAEYTVSCRRNDVSNWESKVSLNDTTEHRHNGDYSNAVSKLNDAKQSYNDAVSRFNSAKAKLNNAT